MLTRAEHRGNRVNRAGYHCVPSRSSRPQRLSLSASKSDSLCATRFPPPSWSARSPPSKWALGFNPRRHHRANCSLTLNRRYSAIPRFVVSIGGVTPPRSMTINNNCLSYQTDNYRASETRDYPRLFEFRKTDATSDESKSSRTPRCYRWAIHSIIHVISERDLIKIFYDFKLFQKTSIRVAKCSVFHKSLLAPLKVKIS